MTLAGVTSGAFVMTFSSILAGVFRARFEGSFALIPPKTRRTLAACAFRTVVLTRSIVHTVSGLTTDGLKIILKKKV